MIVASSPLGSIAMHDPGQCRRFGTIRRTPFPALLPATVRIGPVIVMADIPTGRIPANQEPPRLPLPQFVTSIRA